MPDLPDRSTLATAPSPSAFTWASSLAMDIAMIIAMDTANTGTTMPATVAILVAIVTGIPHAGRFTLVMAMAGTPSTGLTTTMVHARPVIAHPCIVTAATATCTIRAATPTGVIDRPPADTKKPRPGSAQGASRPRLMAASATLTSSSAWRVPGPDGPRGYSPGACCHHPESAPACHARSEPDPPENAA